MPDLSAACRDDVVGMRIVYSPTLGYARPDSAVTEIVANAARVFEDLGCTVEVGGQGF